MPNRERARLKIRWFPGGSYDHVSLTATLIDEDGSMTKVELKPYPESHNITEREEEVREAAFMADGVLDSSDPTPIIRNLTEFFASALSGEIVLVSKEQEIEHAQGRPHEKVTLEIPTENFEALSRLQDKLKAGDYTYSVIDKGGRNEVHCGTVVQHALEEAMRGTKYEPVARRSTFEDNVTTHPTSVFKRAEKIANLQRSSEEEVDPSAHEHFLPDAWHNKIDAVHHFFSNMSMQASRLFSTTSSHEDEKPKRTPTLEMPSFPKLEVPSFITHREARPSSLFSSNNPTFFSPVVPRVDELVVNRANTEHQVAEEVRDFFDKVITLD